ncbi:MAG: hypothetical protein ABI912_00825 [Actinomycetota bacterium]
MDEVATVQARLWKALRESELVRVELGIKGSDAREGYVVAIGRKWLLLRVFDHSIFLDGYSAVRRADVTGVQRGKNGKFVRRALELQGAWPPSPPPGEVSLETTRLLVETAGRLMPLVTLHVERRDPQVCYIGVPVVFRPRAVGLRQITPKATWDRGITFWAFATSPAWSSATITRTCSGVLPVRHPATAELPIRPDAASPRPAGRVVR